MEKKSIRRRDWEMEAEGGVIVSSSQRKHERKGREKGYELNEKFKTDLSRAASVGREVDLENL